MDQAIGANGPCLVPHAAANTTVLNPWSWNNHANLLYIDQPAQTGYSYNVATPGVLDTVTGQIFTEDSWAGPLNHTALKGMFSSQESTKFVNTTAVAAEAIWEFLQSWMSEYAIDSTSLLMYTKTDKHTGSLCIAETRLVYGPSLSKSSTNDRDLGHSTSNQAVILLQRWTLRSGYRKALAVSRLRA